SWRSLSRTPRPRPWPASSAITSRPASPRRMATSPSSPRRWDWPAPTCTASSPGTAWTEGAPAAPSRPSEAGEERAGDRATMTDTPFRPLRRLGHGSMAEVHLADLRLEDGRVVRAAVKRIRPALRRDPEVRRRFAEEAEISAALSHRHVVKVYAAEPGGE